MLIYSSILLALLLASEPVDPDLLAKKIIAAATMEERRMILEEEPDALTPKFVDATLTQMEEMKPPLPADRGLEVAQWLREVSQQIGYQHGVAASWNKVGRFYSAKEDFKAAVDAYNRALELSREIHDLSQTAAALYNLARIDESQGNYDVGLSRLQKSLEIYESLENKRAVSDVLNVTANIHDWKGDHQKALEVYYKSLALREELGDPVAIASSLVNIANIVGPMGKPDLALEYLLKALPLFQTANDKPKLSVVLNNLGNFYTGEGNHRQALKYHLQNLKVAQEIGSARKTAFAYINIGVIYESQGDLPVSRDYYTKAFQLFDELGNQAIASAALANIAGIHGLEGDHETALRLYHEVAGRCAQIGDATCEASIKRNIGQIYELKREFEVAENYLRDSLRRHERLQEKIGIAQTSLVLAAVLREQNKLEESVRVAQQAYQIAVDLGFSDIEWLAKYHMGRGYFGLEKLVEARKELEDSIRTVEKMRMLVAGHEQQTGFLETRIDPYHTMIELLVHQEKAEEAFLYAEKAKARTLVDVLQNGERFITLQMSDEELAQEQALKATLVSANSKLQGTQSEPGVSKENLGAAKEEVEKARTALEIFRTNLYATHPDLKNKRGELQPINLSELASYLDEKTAFLEFVVSKEQVLLFMLTKATGTHQLNVHQIKIPQQSLAQQVSEFRKKIAQRQLAFRDAAKSLYELLLKPAEGQFQGISRIVIVPDGPLWELPFQATITSGGKFLLEEMAVSYVPSFTVFHETLKIKRARPVKLLAFANPRVTAQKPLPKTEEEVRELSQLYGSNNSKLFVGANAKESIFKREMGKFDVVHLATHGEINDASPMYSQLFFTAEGSSEDGILEPWEVLNARMNASLVILSACETGRGAVKSGEGMIGFSWAFFIAGAPSTVVSQWKVESNATTEIMRNFHRLLKIDQADGKSESLRKAALGLLKLKQYQHPFYWAGFVLIGDPS